MTARIRLDDLTSDDLDQLYAERDQLRDQLDQARTASRRLASGLIAVSALLTTPYPDDPRWSPWSRWVRPHLLALRTALAPAPNTTEESGR